MHDRKLARLRVYAALPALIAFLQRESRVSYRALAHVFNCDRAFLDAARGELTFKPFRPEFELPWPRRSHMTPITLNRLERPQVEALVTHRAGGKTLPAGVVSHIVAKSCGL